MVLVVDVVVVVVVVVGAVVVVVVVVVVVCDADYRDKSCLCQTAKKWRTRRNNVQIPTCEPR